MILSSFSYTNATYDENGLEMRAPSKNIIITDKAQLLEYAKKNNIPEASNLVKVEEEIHENPQ